MKKTTLTIKALAFVLLWFGLVGTSSALSVTDDNYVGDMVRLVGGAPNIGPLGVAPETLTTAFITNYHNTGAPIMGNFDASWTDPAPVSHLYRMDLALDLILDMTMEFRADDPMTITFFDGAGVQQMQQLVHFGGGNAQETQIFNDVVSLNAGIAWMLVEASVNPNPDQNGGINGMYAIKLAGTAVPLPPALLLFGSSLLGFITLGWRRSKA